MSVVADLQAVGVDVADIRSVVLYLHAVPLVAARKRELLFGYLAERKVVLPEDVRPLAASFLSVP